MMKMNQITSVALTCLLTFGVAMNAQSSGSTINPTQKKQIENVVHDYIIQNPEIVIQSLQGYHKNKLPSKLSKFEKIQQNSPKFANQLFHQSTQFYHQAIQTVR